MAELIPYISKPRPDTGLTNAKLGIWLFLASEVMLFGALFSSYIFLRTGAPDWQTFAYAKNDPAMIQSSHTSQHTAAGHEGHDHAAHAGHDHADHASPAEHDDVAESEARVPSPMHHSIPMATLNTVILITSSITMVLAWASLVLKERSKFNLYMGLTIALAFGFLFVKYFEYSSKIHSGLVPGFSPLLALYWTMTGLHVLHVIGGIVVNAYHLGPGSKMWDSDPVRFTGRVEVSGLYWHFVDLVWIFLFPVLYLL
ncbi:MAG: cytochrome c oxidase subunit 3 [Verrucomicrobia bacterium]|nr:cytochrome c oxidase subunit 3 [Verrucomicrobiota bacterium]